MINLILMVDEKWGYCTNEGKIYNLPFHEERVKEIVKDSYVLEGLNTFIADNLLAKYENTIVFCPDYLDFKNCITKHSLVDILNYSKTLDTDIYVVGGGLTFQTFLPYADTIYITKINKDLNATKHIKDLSEAQPYIQLESSDTYTEDDITYTFSVYKQVIRDIFKA